MATPSLDRLKARISSHIEGSDSQIEAYALRIQREVERVSRKFLQRLQKQNRSFSEVAAELGRLEQALIDAGIVEEIDNVDDIFLREMAHVRESFDTLTGPVEFTSVEITAAEALINFSARSVQGATTQTLYNITEQALSSYMTGAAPDIEAILETSTGRLTNYINTELATATSGFNRTVTAMKADQLGLELFLYQGPLDKVTRPFCRARVGKVFSLKEMKTWDNGVGLDPLIYLGGFNCRHAILPVSTELARQYGYKGEG